MGYWIAIGLLANSLVTEDHDDRDRESKMQETQIRFEKEIESQ